MAASRARRLGRDGVGARGVERDEQDRRFGATAAKTAGGRAGARAEPARGDRRGRHDRSAAANGQRLATLAAALTERHRDLERALVLLRLLGRMPTRSVALSADVARPAELLAAARAISAVDGRDPPRSPPPSRARTRRALDAAPASSDTLDRARDPVSSAGLAGTGVLGTVGARLPAAARVVALRADLDALPLQDAKEVPYRSEIPGRMHACGHDVHTADAARRGAAARASDCASLPGTVKLIFQPAEETVGGAQAAGRAGRAREPAGRRDLRPARRSAACRSARRLQLRPAQRLLRRPRDHHPRPLVPRRLPGGRRRRDRRRRAGGHGAADGGQPQRRRAAERGGDARHDRTAARRATSWRQRVRDGRHGAHASTAPSASWCCGGCARSPRASPPASARAPRSRSSRATTR